MPLKLYNTLTRKLETFEPANPKQVTFYACGPTVYDYAHIGNLRAFVFDDLVRRTLEFNGYGVKYVMNITDVGHLTGDMEDGEDKMVKAIKREGLDYSVDSLYKLAQIYTDEFLVNTDALNILRPTLMPRATEHVQEMIAIIEKLISSGYVYETSNGFYFDTSKFADYGKLGNFSADELMAGARVEVDPEKKNPADFAVWMKAVGKNDKHVMLWDAPFSDVKGFPGWHIECSAMAMKYLGESIDIHAGGIDHIKVHHTNEIAQSECSTGKTYVKYWLHNEFLVLKDSKMSKSAGTFIRLQDLLDKGFDSLSYRFMLLQAHYRTPLQFSFEALENAQNGLNNLRSKFLALGDESAETDQARLKMFTQLLNEDFDTPKALAYLFDTLNDNEISAPVKRATILEYDKVLGLGLLDLQKETVEAPDEVVELANQRLESRKNKDFKTSDKLRKQIADLGWEVVDTGEGFELKKI